MRSRFALGVITTLAALFVLNGSTTAHAAAVTIRDPAFGLPHVCADNDLNAAREQGFQAAVDRTAQFLLVMSVARGTLHRPLTNLGVSADDDIETRRTGYSRSEYSKMFQSLSADAQAILLAYSDGVNAALNEMMKTVPTIDPPLELLFFQQSAVAGKANLFGNASILTQGEGADPYYVPPSSHPTYHASGFQFTPELALAFAVLQIRNFGYEGWDELGMADSLGKLINTYGMATGTELWDDRYWKNDPLAPVSVPDPRNPGFGGPLAKLSTNQKIEVAKAVDTLREKITGKVHLPGYPIRDYAKAVEPMIKAHQHKKETAIKWGAWPSLGSYAWTISPARSETSNPWVGGFPQTGIQVPSIMHYTEIRGDTMKGNGMAFVGGPYVLIGHTDNVGYTTTTAHLKVIDTYIETLVGGDFDLFKYDNHGTTKDMVKRIELVHNNVGAPTEVPVFRTNQTCSVNGCNGGSRAVFAFSGDHAGTVDSATSTSITDADAGLTPASLVGGYLAIVDGEGAGQIRAISGNTATDITIGTAWTTQPDDESQWVAVASGDDITAVAIGSAVFMEEGEAATGFSQYQKSDDVLDIRSAVRFIPSTHNFLAADHSPFNGVGTAQGTGNIYYGTSGFHQVRQAGELDSRLPIDGAGPEPFAVKTGVVDSAAASSLTDTGNFTGDNFSSEAINFTYDNPDDNGPGVRRPDHGRQRHRADPARLEQHERHADARAPVGQDPVGRRHLRDLPDLGDARGDEPVGGLHRELEQQAVARERRDAERERPRSPRRGNSGAALTRRVDQPQRLAQPQQVRRRRRRSRRAGPLSPRALDDRSYGERRLRHDRRPVDRESGVPRARARVHESVAGRAGRRAGGERSGEPRARLHQRLGDRTRRRHLRRRIRPGGGFQPHR
jgi:hypothetical protein